MNKDLKLILVNKKNILNKEIVEDLVEVPNEYKSDEKIKVINNEVLEEFISLREEALQIGVDLVLDSGYRSFDYQKKIMDDFIKIYGEEYARKTVAPVGSSEHHTGLAIDLTLRINGIILEDNMDLMTNEELFVKIRPLLAKHGFILRYPKGSEKITGYDYEPWHIRYIGKENAIEMEKRNIETLEEYIKLKKENEPNIILDYEQVEEKLNQIVSKTNMITKQPDLAITKYGLPIHYYKIGNGNKEIVITGATHGSEIITTDFVLKLMEEMTKEDGKFKDVNLDEYTFHIIPLLNPEGYLISTSAVRQLIPREMSSKEAEKICREYYLAYRQDDRDAIERKKEGIKPDRTKMKRYQEMFKDIDYTCIPEKYKELRERVKEIYEKYPDIPKGTIINWSANGDGIDIQSNSVHNRETIEKMQANQHAFGTLRHENIDKSHPGPIGCPYIPEEGFKLTIETQTISNLLETLYQKGTLVGYENFHSAGGLVYQRPCRNGNGVEISEDMYWERIVNNIFEAISYSSNTYKNANDQDNSRYTVLKKAGIPTTTNDVFRMKYPADLLIELSGMGGNPIGPYGDLEGNYRNIMESNIDAYSSFLKNHSIIDKISEAGMNLYTRIMHEHNDTSDDKIKEKYIQTVYMISEIIMEEAKKYINENNKRDLEKLLNKGFFSNEIKSSHRKK